MAKQYERRTKKLGEQYAALKAQAEKDGIVTDLASKDIPQWVKDDRLNPVGTVLFDDYLEMSKLPVPFFSSSPALF